MNKQPYITTYKAMNGWKAVHIWWNDQDDGDKYSTTHMSRPDKEGAAGFWEPYSTGMNTYETEAEAINEAKQWSEWDEIRYVPRTGML